MDWIRRNLSPPMVIAFAALFAALAGGAVAAKSVKKNTVLTKSIKNGAVKNTKIADGAVGSAQLGLINDRIADQSVTASSPPVPQTVNSNCLPGEKLLSGGVEFVNKTSDALGITLEQTAVGGGTGWSASIAVQDTDGAPVATAVARVHAYCLAP